MKVLAVLWMVSLVRLCYGGDDDKVDGSLFIVEETEENGLKVLKLTPKVDKVTHVTYDKKQIWSGKARLSKSSNLVEALLYFNEEIPALVTIHAIKGGNKSMVYRYHDGSKWQGDNIDGHKKRLTTLKEKYKHATPTTLDLAKPDESKINMDIKDSNGVRTKKYSPKDAFHISSVMDAGATVWKSSGDEKCVFVESYAKGGVELLYLETSESSGTMSKYFEKTGGVWNELKKDQFYEKAKALIGESGKNASLNISHPNRLLYKSFDYSFSGNAVKLVVPNKGVSVSKLVNDTETVWSTEDGETFDHAKVYLNKDGKAELVLVVTKASGSVKETYLELKDCNWRQCSNIDAKIKSLRDLANYISDFEIDLSASKGTKECTIFEAELLGVTTRHFYPKPGHVSTKVKDGKEELWKSNQNAGRASSENSDYCLSCIIYKHGTEEILEMTLVENLSRRWKYFEKTANGGWKEIDKEEYKNKLNEMRGLPKAS